MHRTPPYQSRVHALDCNQWAWDVRHMSILCRTPKLLSVFESNCIPQFHNIYRDHWLVAMFYSHGVCSVSFLLPGVMHIYYACAQVI